MLARRPVSFALVLALVVSVLVSASVLAAKTLQPHAAEQAAVAAATLPETTHATEALAPEAPDATTALTPSGSIALTPLGTYVSGAPADESGAEISAFDPASNRLFITNAFANTIDIVDISDPSAPSLVSSISDTDLGGSPNSVAVANELVAVAVEANAVDAPGSVAFFEPDGTAIISVEVGVLPDMLTFNAAGDVLMVANEGQPTGDYLTDPEGSVSVISIPTDPATITQGDVTTIGFSAFNTDGALYSQIEGEDIRITGPGASVAQDLEPEYIAFDANDDTVAYVALQENNALAIVDTSALTITDILPLGLKDHSTAANALDASDRDGAINIAPWPISGMYMPDAIDTYNVGGTTYIVTANEGDGREYEVEIGGEDVAQYLDEARVEDLILSDIFSPTLQDEENLGRLIVTRATETLAESALLRVAHASPDTGAVDVYVDDTSTPVLEGITFFTATDYLTLPAGSYDFAVITATETLEADRSNAVISGTATLDAGKEYTLAAVGTSAEITPTLIMDNLVAPEAGQAHVRVYHFSPDAPGVDVVVQGGSPTLVDGLTFPNATSYASGTVNIEDGFFDLVARDYIDVAAGTYDLSIVLSGTTTVVEDLNGVELGEGGIYSVFATDEVANITVETQVISGAVPTIQSYGARSFTIWNADTGAVVFDSGSALEEITAATFPQYFNSDNDEVTFDTRSDAKGPEPEAVTIGTIDGSTYAFVGLERISGVVIYDITDPANPEFVQYSNTRDFSEDVAGDVGPEGIIFIPAADSPTNSPLVVVANEVSGTTTVFEVTNSDGATTLTLLHNNDGESALRTTERTIGPGSGFGNTEEVTLTVGGAASFKTLLDTQVAEARDAGNSVVAAYAGDAFLPSPVLQCSLDDEQGRFFDAIAQRQMPYTLHSIGNHEFDRGPAVLERFIRAFEVNGLLTQPFLAANLDFSAISSFDDLVDADGLIFEPITDGRVIGEALITTDEATGQRFGIVGIAPYYLNNISSPGDVELLSTDAESTRTIIQTQVDRLYDDYGVRKIIVVSHLQDIDEDIAAVQQLRNVDVIVAGGGDELLVNSTVPTTTQLLPGEEDSIFAGGDYPLQVQDADDRTVYIVTTSGSYQYLGRLDVEFDAQGEVTGVLSDTSYIRRNIPEGPNAADNLNALGITDEVAQDQGIIDSAITPLEECLAANDEPILGTAVDINITREDVRSRQTNGGTLITDAYLWAYDEYATANNLSPRDATVIAVQNGGGIRDDFGVSSLPASGSLPGTVSQNDIFSALPFGNTMTVLEGISPTDLKSIFERASSASVESVSPPALSPAGAFLQVSGISVTYNISNTAQVIEEDGTVTTAGERVVAIQLNDGTFIVQDGEVVTGAPNVTIITNGFTANGGDNYPWLENVSEANRTESLVDNNGVVLDYAQVLINYWSRATSGINLSAFPIIEIGNIVDFPEFPTIEINGQEYPTIPADVERYNPDNQLGTNIIAQGGGDDPEPGDDDTIIYLPLVARAEEPVSLTLLHNNDGESGLLPTTVEVEGEELEVGGVAAFSTVADREIADATSQGNAAIMVYAGDAFLASATLQTSFPIDSDNTVFDAVAQSQLPYTAHILGNHEFDYTPDYLARFIGAFDGTQPFLSANLDFSGEPSLDALVDDDGLIEGTPTDGNVIGRSMIVTDTTTGAQFGIVGATTESLDSISSPRNVTVSEAAPAVQAEIDRLQNDFGVNKIILVSHLQDVDNDRALIQELSGVDVAVAGGGDDFLVNPSLPVSSQAIPTEEEDVEGDYPLTEVGADGRTVYIVTSVDKYRYLGRLDVTFDQGGGVISVDTSDSYPRRVVLSGPVATSLGLSDAVEPDATLVSQVNEPLQVALDALANEVIANTEILFNVSRDDVRGGESNIGNLVSDAFLDSYDRYEELVGLSPRSPTNPVVAVQNGGGIRQNAGDTLPRDGQVPGPISRLDTIDVLPFDNTISVVQDVTPADLLAVLDNRSTSGIYQVAGLNLVYNTVTDADDTTYVIDSITLENTDGTTTPLVTGGAVDPAAPATITVVTNSFVANREFAANTNQTDLRDNDGVLILYEQPLREYLQTFPEVGGVPTIPADDARYQPATDDAGRIIIQP